MLKKRADYISWDQYFMGIAIFSGARSKDPHTQVGACIADKNKKVVGLGYNGLPRGLDDDQYPWDRQGEFLETKYAYVCHAELNAILNSTRSSLENCSLYVSLFPCNECAKAIIQSGVSEVVYLSDKYAETDVVKASKKMLRDAGVKLRHYLPKLNKVEVDFVVEK